MAFRIAGWVVLGISCVFFGVAEIRSRRRGTKLPGNIVPFLLLLLMTVGLGIAATATQTGFLNGLLTTGFVAAAVSPWLGVYKKVQERREARQTSSFRADGKL